MIKMSESRMPRGGGKGGGSAPAPAPDTTARDEREREAVDEMRRQMEESNKQLQDAMAEQQARYANTQKEAEEKAAQYKRDQERVSAYDEVDYLTMGRLEAEETAMSSVEDELQAEEADMLTRGVDWKVTEEQKEARIQKRFEEFWGKDSESRLGELMRSWGSPEMSADDRTKLESGDFPFTWDPGRKLEGFDYSQYSVDRSQTEALSPSVSSAAMSPLGKPRIEPLESAKKKLEKKPEKKKSTQKTKLPTGLLPGVSPFGWSPNDGEVSLLTDKKRSILGG